jgi:glycogen debranching enzyme
MSHLLRSPRLAHAVLLVLVAAHLHAQTPTPAPAPVFATLAPIAFNQSGPVLRAPAQPQKPFTVAGPRGVLVGQQDGSFEAWALPVKLISHLAITANIQGYSVPINVNQQAAEIEVRPDRTILTYSHIGFTVRQIMFSPADAPAGTGPIVLFEFDCLHPTEFTLSFTPEMRWMWPERNEGTPSLEWVSPNPHQTEAPGGYYVLHTDYPDFAAAVTMPGAEPGILAPYQERPHDYPAQLKIRIDPARDGGRLFPLLMAYGSTLATANNRALGETLANLNNQIPALYKAENDYWQNFLQHATSISTPNHDLNEAFTWAEISIEQLRTLSQSGETALVAGYYESGDSARPGFGWFFGRDALYTLYAVNGFGDFQLSRDELEFLLHRQRADGKIMHEYSQTAAAVDWQQFPYEYAAADSTPLFLLATLDYVRASGDTAFLSAHRDAILKAWAFETDPAHDTDHDGIYDNSQGTGWVESWPTGMPHQEIYLALLDQQASVAMAQIFSLLHDASGVESAERRAKAIAATINREYPNPEKGCYAFSYNGPDNVDRTTTVYPALAWWSDLNAKPILNHPGQCLQQFASAALDTDWGLRDVANTEPLYNGMSYHQGSVWPLFTGWAALAEYRGGQPLAGYRMLMQNANLTRAQDLGADTELLSGDFFVPFGRSTSHQLWSSAMVVTPTLRGLFGIAVNAQTKTITVDPHLPASWTLARIRNLHVGDETVNLIFSSLMGTLTVETEAESGAQVKLWSSLPGAKSEDDWRFGIPLPGVGVEPVLDVPLPGSRTGSARVLSQARTNKSLTLTLEGMAGTEFRLPYYINDPKAKLTVTGAEMPTSDKTHRVYATIPPLFMIVHFPSGTGWKTITVTLTW